MASICGAIEVTSKTGANREKRLTLLPSMQQKRDFRHIG
jgi:hypothetical protein